MKKIMSLVLINCVFFYSCSTKKEYPLFFNRGSSFVELNGNGSFVITKLGVFADINGYWEINKRFIGKDVLILNSLPKKDSISWVNVSVSKSNFNSYALIENSRDLFSSIYFFGENIDTVFTYSLDGDFFLLPNKNMYNKIQIRSVIFDKPKNDFFYRYTPLIDVNLTDTLFVNYEFPNQNFEYLKDVKYKIYYRKGKLKPYDKDNFIPCKFLNIP
jgi:hypothetical protein